MIYQSAQEPQNDPIYHPTLVGHDVFRQTGAVMLFA